MALVFWTEPVATYDLDVLVFLPEENRPIVTLGPIYEWAARRGYGTEAEHVLIEGVPVQFLPSHDELADEAIETARTVDYEGVPVRVVRPEYLVALYLEPSARTPSEVVTDMRSAPRSRSSHDLLETLYASKKRFHAIRRGLPLRVKVREVMELQRFVLPLLARQRPLRPWERPWQIEP